MNAVSYGDLDGVCCLIELKDGKNIRERAFGHGSIEENPGKKCAMVLQDAGI